MFTGGDLGGGDRGCGCDPSGVWVAERECELRRGVPGVEYQVHRAPAGGDADDGREVHGARQTMKKAKVPILPGSDGVIANEDEALEWAKSVGYPVILKAVAGGGGRGDADLPQCGGVAGDVQTRRRPKPPMHSAMAICTWRSSSSRPRHIEFQVLADEHGNVMSLGEREVLDPAAASKTDRRGSVAAGEPEAKGGAGQDDRAVAEGDRLLERRDDRVPDG